MTQLVARLLAASSLALAAIWLGTYGAPHLDAQSPAERVPTATLIPASTQALGGDADSNSPAVWETLGGRLTFFVMTSFNGWSTRYSGTQLGAVASRGRIEFESPPPPHGVWMEAIIPDVDGTWYGYYHNELPADVCNDEARTIPRIGAARSRDFGATWQDLGTILEAPRGWYDCSSPNRYFVGGVGDFSVVLDRDQQHLYFFFSQYGDRERTQGVAVGRFAWAYRDDPVGRMAVWWRDVTWVPARRISPRGEASEYAYAAGVPIYRVQAGWHNTTAVDAFWGPSVHWNTHLEQYVMLLNRARDTEWNQEGNLRGFFQVSPRSDRVVRPSATASRRELVSAGGGT